MYKYVVIQSAEVAEFEEKCNKLGKENWELFIVTASEMFLFGVFKKYVAS